MNSSNNAIDKFLFSDKGYTIELWAGNGDFFISVIDEITNQRLYQSFSSGLKETIKIFGQSLNKDFKDNGHSFPGIEKVLQTEPVYLQVTAKTTEFVNPKIYAETKPFYYAIKTGTEQFKTEVYSDGFYGALVNMENTKCIRRLIESNNFKKKEQKLNNNSENEG